LIGLRNRLGVILLAAVWCAAIFGIAMKLIFRSKFRVVGMVMYLLMGWIGVVAVQPLYEVLGLAPLIWLVAGGLSYTIGVLFFGWKTLRHHHAVFHLFVLSGSILHYLAVILYLMPYAVA